MESIINLHGNNVKNIDVIYNGYNIQYKIYLAVVEISSFTCYCHPKFLHKVINICLCRYILIYRHFRTCYFFIIFSA